MPAFVLLDLSIHNPAEMEEYKRQAPVVVAAFNGKFIARGGKISLLEGDWKTDRIVIIEFPSVERAKEWWNSEEYSKPKAIRQQAAETKMIVVEGL